MHRFENQAIIKKSKDRVSVWIYISIISTIFIQLIIVKLINFSNYAPLATLYNFR